MNVLLYVGYEKIRSVAGNGMKVANAGGIQQAWFLYAFVLIPLESADMLCKELHAVMK